jgi:hypothetical protein
LTLTNDANYVFTTNETGGTGKPLSSANITNSPITTWLPKLDVEYGTLQSAIDERKKNLKSGLACMACVFIGHKPVEESLKFLLTEKA